MARLAQGAFKFDNQSYEVVSLTVEAPEPEIVDMTSVDDAIKVKRMVRTGDYRSPGRISLDAFSASDPKTLVGHSGVAVFSTNDTPSVSITRHVIVDSVSTDAKIGDVYRARITMMPTDHTSDAGAM
jgi:hypothetical protein